MSFSNTSMDDIDHAAAANYAVNGKIVLSSVLVLFFVVSAVVFFHTYSRCRRRRRSRHSHPHLHLLSGNHRRRNSSSDAEPAGIDPSLLATLPTFAFSEEKTSARHDSAPPPCAVCLSEFEEGDKLRALPKCRHAFHAACIDAWFGSHSSCPLCRSPVTPATGDSRSDVVVVVTVSEPGVSGPQDEWGSSERGERKSRLDLAGLALRDDQTVSGLPERDGVRVKCSLKRIWSI